LEDLSRPTVGTDFILYVVDPRHHPGLIQALTREYESDEAMSCHLPIYEDMLQIAAQDRQLYMLRARINGQLTGVNENNAFLLQSTSNFHNTWNILPAFLMKSTDGKRTLLVWTAPRARQLRLAYSLVCLSEYAPPAEIWIGPEHDKDVYETAFRFWSHIMEHWPESDNPEDRWKRMSLKLSLEDARMAMEKRRQVLSSSRRE